MQGLPPCLLQSPKLTSAGFMHGFGTRHADVGAEATPTMRQEALERLRQGRAFDFAEVDQVHGKDVARATEGGRYATKADAVWVGRDAPEVAGAIRTADCVPILMANTRTGSVAAVHAGWRGLVAGVIEAGVLAIGDANAILCAIGPCIGRDAFEIGPDVADPLLNKIDDRRVVVERGNSLYGDLQCAAFLVLTHMGVRSSAIDRLEHCTFTEAHLFFSYRRDRTSGRQLSFIAPQSRSSP